MRWSAAPQQSGSRRRQLAAVRHTRKSQAPRPQSRDQLKLRSVSLSEPFRTAATRASSPDPCELPAQQLTAWLCSALVLRRAVRHRREEFRDIEAPKRTPPTRLGE